MKIEKAIKIFSTFLNKNIEALEPLFLNRDYTTKNEAINDWLQANWELLVERKVLRLNEYLEVYGEGADFYGDISRITDVEALPTHYIKIMTNKSYDFLNAVEINDKSFVFSYLVGFENGFYNEIPPFDYLLVQDENTERVFHLEQVKFELIKYSDKP